MQAGKVSADAARYLLAARSGERDEDGDYSDNALIGAMLEIEQMAVQRSLLTTLTGGGT